MPITLPDFGANRLQTIFGALATPDSAQSDSTPAQPDILSVIANRLMQPDQNVENMRSQVNQMPQRSDYQPSVMRRIGAAITGIGYGPQAGSAFLNKPFDTATEDWKTKFGATKTVADEDTKNQRDEIAGTLKQESITNNKDKAQMTNELNQEKANNALLIAHDKLKQAYEKLESDNTNKQALLDFNNAKLDMIQKYHEAEESLKSAAASQKGWSIANIPDPKDPTKQIAVRMNQGTGEVKPLSLDGSQVGPVVKPSGAGSKADQVTQTTKAMMEGAQMLRPHIPDILNQAINLDKRGLFGPVMSRVRNYAAKIGTTGSPEQVQQSLNDFVSNISNDPLVKQSNDAAVGQFVTELGLLASGAGRVHGQARGGGSIQMINYMKSLLSSDSTLDMFKGRLKGLDSYMKGYAEGPNASSGNKTKLDSIIDEILSGVKK